MTMLTEVHVINGEPTFVNVLVDGELFTAIKGVHPAFQAIVDTLNDDPQDRSVLDLFDIQRAVTTKFQRLTDRVIIDNGVVLYDGDPVHEVLAEQIMRYVEEDVEDWQNLVNFLEKLMANPNPNSREQLYLWLSNKDFTITPNGDFVGYKGCYVEDGVAVSTVVAPERDEVRVDDEKIVDRRVPQPPGAVVTMPRSIVDPEQGRTCSRGLHVGTDGYARSFAGSAGVVNEVHVSPTDVVSVTSDSSRQKIRTCRYTVIGPVNKRYETATLPAAAVKRAEDVTKARKVLIDTRQNHLAQKRYPKGHDKAGQFIPRDSADYNKF